MKPTPLLLTTFPLCAALAWACGGTETAPSHTSTTSTTGTTSTTTTTNTGGGGAATHGNVAGNPVAIAQTLHFIDTHFSKGVAEIIDPYKTLGVKP